MSLPIIKPVITDIMYNDIILPSSDIVIRCRDYTVKDIKIYLKNINKADDKFSIQKSVFSLIRSCVHQDDLIKFDKLHKVQFIWILIYLRMNSVSDSIPYPHTCPNTKCNFLNNIYTMGISENLKFNFEKLNDLVFDDLVLKFKPLSFSEELKMITTLDKNDTSKLTDYTIANQIDSIIFNNELYDNLNCEDIILWVEEQLSPKEYQILMNHIYEYENKNYIYLEKDENCISCQNSYRLLLDDFNFFIMA